jgi:transcriptional regulator with XRE-family HTH domain
MDSQVLGRQVLKKRKEMGLSQGVLAQRAGISRQYVSYIEQGKARNVSINILNQLATALEKTPAELTGQTYHDEALISPVLRQFALSKSLSFYVVDKLSHIPRRGQEPQTVEEWRQLYEAIRPYLE